MLYFYTSFIVNCLTNVSFKIVRCELLNMDKFYIMINRVRDKIMLQAHYTLNLSSWVAKVEIFGILNEKIKSFICVSFFWQTFLIGMFVAMMVWGVRLSLVTKYDCAEWWILNCVWSWLLWIVLILVSQLDLCSSLLFSINSIYDYVCTIPTLSYFCF